MPLDPTLLSSIEVVEIPQGRKTTATFNTEENRRVVSVDPNFAVAYARLSLSYYNSLQLELAIKYAQKAFELRERTSEREKFYITSRYYSDATGDLEKAIETFELWKQTYPRDFTPFTTFPVVIYNSGSSRKPSRMRANPFASIPAGPPQTAIWAGLCCS